MELPRFALSGVGSLPFSDEDEALSHAAAAYPDLPAVPELPQRAGEPGMISGAWPAVVGALPTAAGATLHVGPAEIRDALDAGARAASPREEIAARRMLALGRPQVAVHFPGPATLLRASEAVGLRGDLWSQPRLREPAAQFVAGTGARLSAAARAAGVRLLFVLDDPLFSAPAIDVDNPANLLLYSTIVDAVRAAGGDIGLHSCGPPPVAALLHLDFSFAHFDAVAYGPELAARRRTLERFVRRGATLGLGVVDARRPAADDAEAGGRLAGLPVGDGTRIVLSTSCGTGLSTPERERAAVAALSALRARLLGEPS
jgi:hypothetical protein